MRKQKNCLWLFILLTFVWSACSETTSSPIPPPPLAVKDVKEKLKAKNFHTTATGYYGALTINDKPTAEWLDTAEVKEKMIKDVLKETNSFTLSFVGDSAVMIGRAGTSFPGQWAVENEADEEEEHGIYLRISFEDPEFKLPGGDLQQVTYSYQVKGVSDKALLIELPREINRRKLVSLMEL